MSRRTRTAAKTTGKSTAVAKTNGKAKTDKTDDEEWTPPAGAKRHVTKHGNVVWRDERGRIIKGNNSPNGVGSLYTPEVREVMRANGERATELMSRFLNDPKAFGAKGWLDQKSQLKLLEMASERAYGRPDGGKAQALRAGFQDLTEVAADALTAAYEATKGDLPEFRNVKQQADVVDVTPEPVDDEAA